MTDTCQHDPTYRIENEANGGAGCPLCNRKRVIMVQHAGGRIEVDDVPPGYFVNHAAMNETAAQLASGKVAEFEDWQRDDHGAGCAGNSADQYDSASEGHW
jgi:hypothetical protein